MEALNCGGSQTYAIITVVALPRIVEKAQDEERTYQDIGHVLLDLGLDFLDLCSQIRSEPLITKPARSFKVTSTYSRSCQCE